VDNLLVIIDVSAVTLSNASDYRANQCKGKATV